MDTKDIENSTETLIGLFRNICSDAVAVGIFCE